MLWVHERCACCAALAGCLTGKPHSEECCRYLNLDALGDSGAGARLHVHLFCEDTQCCKRLQADHMVLLGIMLKVEEQVGLTEQIAMAACGNGCSRPCRAAGLAAQQVMPYLP